MAMRARLRIGPQERTRSPLTAAATKRKPDDLGPHGSGRTAPTPPSVSAEAHNEVIDAALDKVNKLEPRLAAILQTILNKYGRIAASNFERHVTRHLTSAGDIPDGSAPDWTAPYPDQLIDVDALVKEILSKTQPIREALIRQVMTPAMKQAGLNFDVSNPLIGQQIANSGSQVTSIADTTRQNIMNIIGQAVQAGLTVPQTSSLIQTGMQAASVSRATMIARTEMGRAVNGASLTATKLVSNATGDKYNKTWHTAPGATYPRHEDYDDLDGQTVGLDEAFDVGGDELQYPGDPSGDESETINCRCAMSYMTPEGEQESEAEEPPDLDSMDTAGDGGGGGTLDVGPPQGDTVSIGDSTPVPAHLVSRVDELGLDKPLDQFRPSSDIGRQIYKDLPDTQQIYSTLGDQGQRVYEAEREQLHQDIIAAFFKDKVAPEGGGDKYFFTAGGGASGKGSASFLVDGVERSAKELDKASDWIVVDPDRIKKMLPEFKSLQDQGDLYAANGVHEESSDLAKIVLREANERGFNVVEDGTFSSGKSLAKAAAAKADGKEVQVTMFSIPTNRAIERAIGRAENPESSSYGRYVALQPLKQAHAGSAQNLAIFSEDSQNIDMWRVFDNEGDSPVLVASGGANIDKNIADPEKFAEILAKADEKPGSAGASVLPPADLNPTFVPATTYMPPPITPLPGRDNPVFVHFNDLSEEWKQGLSAQEKDDVRAYTGSSHRGINGILRGGKYRTYDIDKAEYVETDKDIADLTDKQFTDEYGISKQDAYNYAAGTDSALSKAPALPSNTTIYRGMDPFEAIPSLKQEWDSLGTPAAHDAGDYRDRWDLSAQEEMLQGWLDDNAAVGSIISPGGGGFQSFSLNPGFAARWGGAGANRTGLVYRVLDAKTGAPLSSVASIRAEQEVLVPRDVTYRVLGVHKETMVDDVNQSVGENATEVPRVVVDLQEVEEPSRAAATEGTATAEPLTLDEQVAALPPITAEKITATVKPADALVNETSSLDPGKADMDAAMAAMGEQIRVPKMPDGFPPIEAKVVGKIDYAGNPEGLYSPLQRKLQVRRLTDRYSVTTHEFGHALDSMLADPERKVPIIDPSGTVLDTRPEVYATQNIQAAGLGDWYSAIVNTPTIRNITDAMVQAQEEATAAGRDLMGTDLIKVNGEEYYAGNLLYVTNEQELFARSYVQWLAQKDTRLADHVAEKLALDRQQVGYWYIPKDEFEPVAQAMTDYFRQKGLLVGDDAIPEGEALPVKSASDLGFSPAVDRPAAVAPDSPPPPPPTPPPAPLEPTILHETGMTPEVQSLYQSQDLDTQTLMKAAQHAVEEMPERLVHGNTGETGFWIAHGKVYSWGDWSKMSAEEKSVAVPVHSHSGVNYFTNTTMDETHQPWSSADVYQWFAGLRKGTQGGRQMLLYATGRADIIGIGPDTDISILKMGPKKLDKSWRDAGWYPQMSPDAQREALRGWFQQHGMTYQEIQFDDPERLVDLAAGDKALDPEATRARSSAIPEPYARAVAADEVPITNQVPDIVPGPASGAVKNYDAGLQEALVRMSKTRAAGSSLLPSDEPVTEAISPEAYKAQAEQAIKDAVGDSPQVRIRVPAESISQVIKDRRFKSQFETGTSKGALAQNQRKNAEAMMFGYPNTLPVEKRPIYGYLAGSTDEGPDGLLSSYGDVMVTLKQEAVNGRTTFTLNDSLGPAVSGDIIPTAILDPGISSWDVGPHAGYDIVKKAEQNPGDLQAISQPRVYAEAQVHGGVSTDDIDEVVFSREGEAAGIETAEKYIARYEDAPVFRTRWESTLAGLKSLDSVRDQLTRAGIPWRWVDSFREVEGG